MSTMYTNPMISTSVRAWTLLGYLYQKDNRRFVSLLPNGTLGFMQISYLLFSGETLEDLTLNSFFTVILVNSMVSAAAV